MRKTIIRLIALFVISMLCVALAGCSPSCKTAGCSNDPAQLLGVKSDYCLLHIANELR